jgi:hypothetical protein
MNGEKHYEIGIRIENPDVVGGCGQRNFRRRRRHAPLVFFY